jgi:hypothetical protein
MISRWAEEKGDNNQGKTMPWKAADFTGGALPRQTQLQQATPDSRRFC